MYGSVSVGSRNMWSQGVCNIYDYVCTTRNRMHFIGLTFDWYSIFSREQLHEIITKTMKGSDWMMPLRLVLVLYTSLIICA